MKSLKVSFFLPALVLIALLGFGATGALAYAGPSGSDGWGTSPIAGGKVTPGDQTGVAGSVNLGATQDVTGAGPVISQVKVKQITQTSATVTWKTDDQDSDSKVEYGTSVVAGSLEFMMLAAADATPGINHAVALADLSPNTVYYFRVESSVGDVSSVDDNDGDFYSFTTGGEDIPELDNDPTVTTDPESGLVSKSFVGIWSDGVVDTVSTVSVTSSDVTFIQQGNGRKVDLPMPKTGPRSDGLPGIEATGPDDEPIDIKWPGSGKDNSTVTLDELMGRRVVVHAEYVDGEWVVLWVIVKPTKPAIPTQGVVKTVENGVLTIETPNGKIHTFGLKENRGKSGEVHPGDAVTVFHGNSGQAKGLVRAAEVASRLEGFLADIEGEHDADDDEEVVGNETADERSGRRAHNARSLETLLERLENVHLANLSRVSGHSRGKARVDFAAATARLEARLERRQANFERLMAKLEARGEAAHRGDGDVARPGQGQAQGDDGDTTPGGDHPGRGQARSGDGDTTPGGDRPDRGFIPTPHSDGDGSEEEPDGDGGSS